CLQTKNFPWTF
nr:immunoglobulin light chain junction region [Macaca mulatta]MOX51519.1 immunoglobulin light chain junction region [Macaca mulatta]MOX51593.1 immunoglobulin light chain junction region [Macaca mulatta]MOX51603.1 immunoglobulin light chain junction region [Macaca mulatta]MOX51646.1 immunoglobulin light chain junction region [Macaca mulatta]